MIKNIWHAIVALMVTIFVGSLFIWAIAASFIAIAFAIAQLWGFFALFVVASFCWFMCGVFFFRLSRQRTETREPNSEDKTGKITPFDRRVASVFGLVIGAALGLCAGITLMVFAVLSAGSFLFPVAVMIGIIGGCALLCCVLPDVGPEILSQLDTIADGI